VPIALVFIAYLALAGARPLLELIRRVPELRPTLIGFAILLALGYAMNDTGILVPGIMLGVLTPVLIALTIPALTTARGPSPPPVPEPRQPVTVS
jgi:hypothetical protein